MEIQSVKINFKILQYFVFSRDIPHMTFFSFPSLLYAMLHANAFQNLCGFLFFLEYYVSEPNMFY